MSDRELLELAAKAVGLCWQDWSKNCTSEGIPVDDWPYDWNPLINDGDALRLAVKLNIDLMFKGRMVDGAACTSCIFPLSDDYEALSELNSDDVGAATRRAIVRAAAEIGSAM